MLSRRMKWVGTPISASRTMRYSEMRLLSTPFVVGIVLEVLHQGAGLGSLEENLGLAFVNASASHDVTLGSVRGSQ
jgi:hypothetical protein